ncbi:hypothetical protein OHA21_50380 [Actinoplanes sp. NBC_00393]|uniref:hypothetical protein n=1 Tax=Actinoplanes sp. NBC_00393 TaxID=2975953 RepID=UPI002E21A879
MALDKTITELKSGPPTAARDIAPAAGSATASARPGILDIGFTVTLLGLLSYGFARFLVDGFLAPFHLSFDEIGLDYGKLVASGILFTIPSTIVILVVYRTSENFWRHRVPRLMNARTDARRLAAFAMAFALAVALLYGLYFLARRYLPLPDHGRETWWGETTRWLLLGALITAILALLFDSRLFFRKYWQQAVSRVRDEPAGPMPGRWPIVVGGVMSAVLLGLFCFTGYSLGSRYAATVQAGQRLDLTVLGLRLPGVAAKPVRIVMVDSTAPAPRPAGSCLLMIGERGETVVFYDHRTEEIFRISTQNMYTVEDVDADSC